MSFKRSRPTASRHLVVPVALGSLAFIPATLCLAGGPVYPTPQAKMGAPIQGLTSLQLQRFINGSTDYNHTFSETEGLGPAFNKASCANCHNNPVGGTGSQTVTRFGIFDKGGFNPLTELGGSLLQELAISESCLESVPEGAFTAQRVTNGSMGYGLVEAIPDAALLANRDAQPRNVRGVAHMVSAFEDPPMSPLRVGRFGWKAQVATILTFSADASLNEVGLTNRFITQENAPNGDPVLLAACDGVADPEDHADGSGLHFIDRVTDFQRYMTQPPQTPRSGMSGEAIFNSIGCNVCHTPSFTTSTARGLEDALKGKVIRPYSDFLLHDMGINADFIVQGMGTEQLMRTPPLWGLRDRDPMWHDGRVAAGTFTTRVTQAIALHGGNQSQGIPAANAYAALSTPDKNKVLAFLNSLGRIEFDADGDEDIDLIDFNSLKGCYGAGPYNADHACAVHDIDQDGDLDSIDAGSFLIASSFPRRDCNGNGVTDWLDILATPALDANNDGILDACAPSCAGDVNGTHTVNTDDLVAVITQWGACPAVPLPCTGDINGTQSVDTDDLILVITTWGACP